MPIARRAIANIFARRLDPKSGCVASTHLPRSIYRDVRLYRFERVTRRRNSMPARPAVRDTNARVREFVSSAK